MKNKIKEGDMVEYKYFPDIPYRTFGLVERLNKDQVWVQWLWTESPQGEMVGPEHQPRQNYLMCSNKDKLILVG